MEIRRFLLSGGVVASVDMKNLRVVALNKGSMDLLASAKNMKVENVTTVVAQEAITSPGFSNPSMDEQVKEAIDSALGTIPAIEKPETNIFDSPNSSVLKPVTEQPSLYSLNSQPLEPIIEETQKAVVAPVVETNKTTEELLTLKLAEAAALVRELKENYESKLNLAYMQLATEKQRADKAEEDLRVLSGGVENIMSSGMGM